MEPKDLGGNDQEGSKHSSVFRVPVLLEAKACMQEAGCDAANVEKVEGDSVAAPEKLEILDATSIEKCGGGNLEVVSTDENRSLDEAPVMTEEMKKHQAGEVIQTEREDKIVASPALAAELRDQATTVEDKGDGVLQTDNIGSEKSKGSIDQSQELPSIEANEIKNAPEQTKQDNDDEIRASPLAIQIELSCETKVSGVAEEGDCANVGEMKGGLEKADEDKNMSMENAVQENEIQKPADDEKTGAVNMQPRKPEASLVATNDCADTIADSQCPVDAGVKIDDSKSEVSSTKKEKSGGTHTQLVTEPGLESEPVEEAKKPSEKVGTSDNVKPIGQPLEHIAPPAIENEASGAADSNMIKVPLDSVLVSNEPEPAGGCVKPEVCLKEQSSSAGIEWLPCIQVSSADDKLHSLENIGGCVSESDVIKEAVVMETGTHVGQQGENPTSDMKPVSYTSLINKPTEAVEEAEINVQDAVIKTEIIVMDAVIEAEVIAKDALDEASTGLVDSGTENPTDPEVGGCSSEKIKSTGPVVGASRGEQGDSTSEESRPSSCVPPLAGLNLTAHNLTLRSLDEMWKIVPKGFKAIAPEVQCQKKTVRAKKSDASGDSAPSNDDDTKEEKRGNVSSLLKKNDREKRKEKRKQRKEDEKLYFPEVTEENEVAEKTHDQETKQEASAAPTTAIDANVSAVVDENVPSHASASDSYSSDSEIESDQPLRTKWKKAGKKGNREESEKPGIAPSAQSENKLPGNQKRAKGGRKKQGGENVRENVQSVPIMKERSLPRNSEREFTTNYVETSGQQYPFLCVPPYSFQNGLPYGRPEKQKYHAMGSSDDLDVLRKFRPDPSFDSRNVKEQSPAIFSKFEDENHWQHSEHGGKTKARRTKHGKTAPQQEAGMNYEDPVLNERNQHQGNHDIGVRVSFRV